jgi:DNA polymerase III subunit epsilon
MPLNLNKPIAFFDIETTGLNMATDKIVEIAVLKVLPDGSKHNKTLRINPEMPIPKEVSAIHGITDEDVKDCPTFKQIGHELANFFEQSDLAGYNSNKFDIPFLVEEFLRAEVDFDMKNRRLVDVQTVFHKMEQRTLSAAYKFYCKKELLNAHSAEADINATYEVLEAQLERYSDTLKNDVAYLHSFTSQSRNVDLAGRIVYNGKGDEVFNFGKHTGKSVTEVFQKEPSYYDWMMKGDFPLFTKKVITAIRLRAKNSIQ